MVELESSSPGETERIGAAVARQLGPGPSWPSRASWNGQDDLRARRGAGAWDRGAVTSPTYTIGHRYRGDLDVSHLDLYRFDGMSDAEWGDLELTTSTTRSCSSSGPRPGRFLPPSRVQVRLRHTVAGHRLISLESSEKALEIRLSTGADPRV